MRQKLLLSMVLMCFCFLQTIAQRTITGTVLSKEGTPLSDASVTVIGDKTGVRTGSDGTFSINVPATAKQLQISYVGSETQKVTIVSVNKVAVVMETNAQALENVVVIGYGSARKKDLTGAVSSIQAKDFNKGTYSSPDQLIQGKAAGVQMINSSGQPGGLSIVKIRGNATVTGTGQPLYVVDGVPLDGRSPRPGVDIGFGGSSPGSNPLNFINPTDIASIDILKDASATAIYGSRGAYGVVLITTKKGKAGQSKIDFNESIGFSQISKRLEVLDANQFRQALTYYGVNASNDHGGDVNALDAILRTATVQNYNIAMSGGNENGRYRLSLGVLDQEGIIRKSGIKKYSANFSVNLKFLESKKLGLDITIIPSQYIEDIAPVTNNGGAGGSLIGHALQWNPTQPLKVKRANGSDSLVDYRSNSIYNPLAVSEAVNDRSKVTTILASVSPYFKFTDWLVYKFQYSIDYASGTRRSSVANSIEVFDRVGFAAIGQNELSTEQFTHTLSFDKSIANDLNLNAVVGFEYLKYVNKGSNFNGRGQGGVPGGFGNYGLDYTNYIQYSNATNRVISSFVDPTQELQSYFGRAVLNYRDKYLLTGTFRRDGSTKFGKNNKYGNFPSAAVGWNISKEEFFKVAFINSLKLRGGWGKTGNQEFPSGASQNKYAFQSGGGQTQVTNGNPLLKWQSDRQYNIGLDITVLKNRISATVDYFNKLTTDLLFPTIPIQPAPANGVVTWQNIAGEIENKGVEATVSVSVIQKEKFSFDIGANATFLKNSVSGLKSQIQTGALSGQGSSGATVEILKNGLPINAFYTRRFAGFDKTTGLAIYPEGDVPSFVGDPNPKTLLGVNLSARYQKLSVIVNFNGNFGQDIYIETLNNVVNVGDIKGGRNIAVETYKNPVKESFGNPVTSSSRFIENASYLKMTNATLSYNFGNIGKSFQNISIYATGQNLFTITDFKGFDPEVNVDKNVSGVPSVGIEYEPYPSARTITFGVNFSL